VGKTGKNTPVPASLRTSKRPLPTTRGDPSTVPRSPTMGRTSAAMGQPPAGAFGRLPAGLRQQSNSRGARGSGSGALKSAKGGGGGPRGGGG